MLQNLEFNLGKSLENGSGNNKKNSKKDKIIEKAKHNKEINFDIISALKF